MIPAKQELVLGTGSLGVSNTREEAYRLLDAYIDLGGSILDTAAVYSDWVPGEARRSETIIGEWLKRSGKRPMIVTKGGHPPVANVHSARLDRASVQSDCEISLRALGIDRIDLYFLHRDDPARPVADIMETLAGLLREGKIAAIGVSNWTPARIAEARATGIAPIASSQPLGNVLANVMDPLEDDTTLIIDAAALRDAEANDMSLMLFTSQAQGTLTKRAQGLPPKSAPYRTAASLEAADELVAIAREIGVEPTNLGVAFMLQFSPRFLPIVGPASVERLKSSLQAREVKLEASVMDRIARITGFDAYRD